MERMIVPAIAAACMTLVTARASAAEPVTREGVSMPLKAVVLSASLREVITDIAVEEGDRITKGQVLVTLECAKEKLSVVRLEQMVAKAEFDSKAAKRLFEQNVSSRDEMLSKEVELKRLQAELAMAQAEVAERQILAPFDGVVVYRLREPGEAVNEADPILKVIDADQLLLLFHLDARMLAHVRMGEKVDVLFPEMTPELKRQAVVTFIDPEVDPRSGLFRVRLQLDNQDQAVRPGMKVLATFSTK